MYELSIVIIVISNVLYNLLQKSTPQKANPFAALLVTYVIAGVLALLAFYFTGTDKSIIQSFGDLNWTSIGLGFTIAGLEFGYLMAYRAGWNISIGSLVANIILALALIPIGVIFFREQFEMVKVIGAVFCIIGLMLINK